MTKGFSNFINTVTGEVVTLPSHYDGMFDTLELTDQDVECTDCNTPDAPEVEAEALAAEKPADVPFIAPTALALTEPAKRQRRR